MRRNMIIGIGALLVLVIGVVGFSQLRQPAPPPTSVPAEADTARVVWASGKVIPVRWAELGFQVGGQVAQVAVKEGDRVEKGQVLARLDSVTLEAQVAQTRAALSTAEAQLAEAKRGARAEELRATQERLASAQAQVAQAQAAVKRAQAALTQAQQGASQFELDQARQAIDMARNQLYGAQARRDAVGDIRGDPTQYQKGTYEAAQAEVLAAQVAVDQAINRYEQLKAGATQAELDARRADVAAAQAQVTAAQAQAREAQAQFDLLQAGPSRESIAVVEARVHEAEAALAQAEAALQQSRIVAPFGGTVGSMNVREGEVVSAMGATKPALVLGDLEHLRVETTDLRETDVARVQVGQSTEITLDALPGARLPGKITRIAPMATQGQGGTNYTVTAELDQPDPRLRWGMTAFVNISVER